MSRSTSHADLSSQILSDIITHMKYARYIDSEKRRMTWEECVRESEEMHIRKFPELEQEIRANFKYVYSKEVLTSMRSLQYGGLPIELSPNRIYNCAFGHVDDVAMFHEVMFLLMGGSGVGFSVQKQHVAKLPEVRKPEKDIRYLIGDSVEGWSDAVKALINAYMGNGPRPRFDDRDIRPKGSRIKKAGGKAPGPEKLMTALRHVEAVLISAIGRKLDTIEVHDITCYIADCIVSGGIRSSAMISLFSPDDVEMITCKGSYPIEYVESYKDTDSDKHTFRFRFKETNMNTNTYGLYPIDEDDIVTIKVGEYDVNWFKETNKLPFFYLHPQRWRANNSMLIKRGSITKDEFFALWKMVEESGSGEPGIYWTEDVEQGTNPCAEIGLNTNQFCNLTTINGALVSGQEDFNKKAKVSAFLGTLQATYTDFHYLRPIWRETTEAEHLLGNSITNIAYNRLEHLDKEQAALCVLEENERVAKLVGVKPAARTTCIKPEGTSTLLLGTHGSGVHGVHDDFFLRSIRVNKADAIYGYLVQKVPQLIEDEFGDPENKAVISIPVKAPDGVITRHESPIDLLERIKDYSTKWVRPGHRSGINTHNVSATISIKPEEWQEVGQWMWDNKEYYNGLSCLPYDGGIYKQAPLQTITEEEYLEKVRYLNSLDLTEVIEDDDNTDLINELACAGGACTI